MFVFHVGNHKPTTKCTLYCVTSFARHRHHQTRKREKSENILLIKTRFKPKKEKSLNPLREMKKKKLRNS
jgi:hypothetical protein